MKKLTLFFFVFVCFLFWLILVWMRVLVFFLLLSLSAAQLSQIQHVITLMMENRSFDHLLGLLHLINPDIDGLTGMECNPTNTSQRKSPSVCITQQTFDTGPDDPCHEFDCITEQIYGTSDPPENALPLMNGFVQNALENGNTAIHPMTAFTTETAPVINTLAQEFAVFDKWYCSLPGPTDPNRGFVMSGTSDSVITNFNGTLWTQQSYFDFLSERNVTWNAYYDQDPWAIMYFKDTHVPENAQNVKKLEQFYWDLQKEEFPQFVFLQPSMNPHPGSPPTWQHPDASVSAGEKLIKDLYEAIRFSPHWNSSLFIITYDENGGFYDHVGPPQTGVPPPDNRTASNGFAFDRLGIRVPTLAISPWIQRGTVVHEATGPTPTSQYESTSIMATANKIFGITDHLTQRDAWAGTFTESLAGPFRSDTPTELPSPRQKRFDLEKQYRKPMNDHQKAQVLFYCLQNFDEMAWEGPDDTVNTCGKGLVTQGDVIPWLEKQIRLFEETRLPHVTEPSSSCLVESSDEKEI